MERSFPSASNLLSVVGLIVSNGHNRYVWRGQKDINHLLRSSLHRRFDRSGAAFEEAAIVRCEETLLRAARSSGYDSFGGRKLTDIELLALLQHEGAATRFIDVTPDPFIALFFACEGAAASNESAALIAIRVEARQVVSFSAPNPHVAEGAPFVGVFEQVKQAALDSGLSDNENLYLWRPPPLNERIKVQRGMFVIGGVPHDPGVLNYSSIDFRLLNDPQGRVDAKAERTRVEKVCNPSQGRFINDGGPRLMVLRISPKTRRELQSILEERFGYRTESIYPDFSGFARAHAQDVLLR